MVIFSRYFVNDFKILSAHELCVLEMDHAKLVKKNYKDKSGAIPIFLEFYQ